MCYITVLELKISKITFNNDKVITETKAIMHSDALDSQTSNNVDPDSLEALSIDNTNSAKELEWHDGNYYLEGNATNCELKFLAQYVHESEHFVFSKSGDKGKNVLNFKKHDSANHDYKEFECQQC